jgi:hypothetical protein
MRMQRGKPHRGAALTHDAVDRIRGQWATPAIPKGPFGASCPTWPKLAQVHLEHLDYAGEQWNQALLAPLAEHAPETEAKVNVEHRWIRAPTHADQLGAAQPSGGEKGEDRQVAYPKRIDIPLWGEEL